ncbi:MAG: hypothetical protein DDT23_01058 [candidate division WS2 bacterium]|nr:hypothetical protein [Candidatus Lithacetigena glycinireducens]
MKSTQKLVDAVLLQVAHDCMDYWETPEVYTKATYSHNEEEHLLILEVPADSRELLKIKVELDKSGTITIQLSSNLEGILEEVKCTLDELEIEVLSPWTKGAPTYRG